MLFNRHGALRLTLVLFLLALPGIALAERLVMSNGDVITGNISRIEDKKVFIEPAYADEFSVKLANVVSIETEEVFEIELTDGQKLSAMFVSGADGNQTIQVNGETLQVAMTDLAAAEEPEKYFDHTSHVDLNATWNGGNTDSISNLLYADTNIKVGDHRHMADLTFRRDETNGVATKEQDLLRYSYNWLFNDPWFMGASASFERDPIRELDHRYTLGLLVGRDIFDDARKFLNASIGVGYTEEKISGMVESGATGLWHLVYEHDFRDGDLTFFHDNSLSYQFFGANNAILKTNTGFRFDIYKDIYTNVSLRYDYETEPAADAKNHDTTLAIGVGAKF